MKKERRIIAKETALLVLEVIRFVTVVIGLVILIAK